MFNFIAVIIFAFGTIYHITLGNITEFALSFVITLLNLPATSKWLMKYYQSKNNK